MKSASHRLSAAALATLLITLNLTSCSSTDSVAKCEQITVFKTSLIDKADEYWEADYPKNGGNGEYARSEALIIEADHLVVDNPSCFTKKEVSLSAGRLDVNSQEDSPLSADDSSSTTLFDQPAQNYLLASGINSLLAVWGIPLNDLNGPRTLGAVSDDILGYLNANAGGIGDLTRDDLLTSLQPGNSLNSMVYRLFSSEEVIDAVVERWLSYLS